MHRAYVLPDIRPRMAILSDIRLSMVILARYKAKEGNPILDIRSRMSIIACYTAEDGNLCPIKGSAW